jgi:hypothetical protein
VPVLEAALTGLALGATLIIAIGAQNAFVLRQGLKRERWLDDRKAELLDARYFHQVFTLPHTLNPFILNNKKVMLDLLFQAVMEVLTLFALDPQWRLKGELGVIAVLHTWSQTLIDHFHLHCLIPGGALSTDRKSWKKAGKKFLFRPESLAKALRNRYLDLQPVVEKLADHFKLKALTLIQDDSDSWWVYNTTWMLLAREHEALDVDEFLDHLRAPSLKTESMSLWTDDHAALFPILR